MVHPSPGGMGHDPTVPRQLSGPEIDNSSEIPIKSPATDRLYRNSRHQPDPRRCGSSRVMFHQRPRRGGHTSGCGINPAVAGLHHVPHSREDRPESISRDCSKQQPALQGKLLSATLYGWAMRSQVASRTRTEFRDLRTHMRSAMPILRHLDQTLARAGEYKNPPRL